MIRIRIRKDGARELKVENEVHNIPHDHELAPNPTFAAAYREAFFVNSLYMSVSLSDIACANAFVDLAAAQDLTVMSERLKKPEDLLEYVVVHEMVHLIEPRHNERFIDILAKHYPNWRVARAELNELPLTAEAWSA